VNSGVNRETFAFLKVHWMRFPHRPGRCAAAIRWRAPTDALRGSSRASARRRKRAAICSPRARCSDKVALGKENPSPDRTPCDNARVDR
jgi:hypothetical protein